ncbi:MAG: 2-phospho-L-lactate transferase [Novosphingobium sp.]|nr:MAG: 2-phospho-L-lactate transferase [Novosphingobium sp.]
MSGHILALSGGVGGAKLAAGFAAVLPPENLTIAVNTGDDFEHLGLTICPDIDSVTYALAGLNDTVRGWGVVDESWRTMERLGALGEASWFNLGDRDMAMHLARSWRLRAGESLSEVTARLTQALGIGPRVVPMSDAPVRTQVETEEGWLDFQHYFVREQCRPAARAIRFDGTPGAAMSSGLAEALARPDLAAVILCPSNPFLSVDPILAVDGVRDALAARKVPFIAVSPLVGGQSLKGPLGKLLGELGRENSNAAIAAHYAGLLDHLIIDESDAADAGGLRASGICATVTPTVMYGAAEREQLARVALSAARLG